MKVLLLDVNCRSGSTGKIVYDLYTQLRAEGNDAAICYGRGGLVEGENIVRFAPKAEVLFHALMTRITGWTGCFSPISTRRLIRFIEAYQPDVIHIHELYAYFVNVKPLLNYIRAKNIKTVWTFHCELMYTGKCGHAYECENWKTVCGRCPHLRDYPKSLVFDFTKEMFLQKKRLFAGWENLTIVTPSQWLADRVKQSFLGDKSIVVIPNGIDTQNIFYPRSFEHLRQKHHITHEKVVLALAPGLMDQRKGGRYVLQLADQLKNEPIRFILIGVTDLAEKFPSNVIALGRTENQEELAEYYSMAEAFVICSRMENLPTTCLEALACGTPVCGFDVGGTAETAPGELGSFVPYGDVAALAATIVEMMGAKAVVSQRCQEYASISYSKNCMYGKYLYWYKNVGQNATLSSYEENEKHQNSRNR